MAGRGRPRSVPAGFRIAAPSGSAYAGYGADAKAQFKEILAGFTEFVRELEEEVTPEAMQKALKPTFALSQKYVPYDTGELHSSGYLRKTRGGRGSVRVEMGYGRNGLAPYAAFVHERTDIVHKEPTRAKFLQAALDEDYYNILNRIVAHMKGYF